MTTKTLTIASIKMFLRNRQALFFTLFMPFIFIGIFGLIGFDRPPRIAVGVVTGQPDQATSEFLDQLAEIEVLELTPGAEAAERAALANGDRVLVLLIPDQLFPAPDQPVAGPQTITILKNVSQEQSAQTAITVISQVLDKTTLRLAQAPELFKLDVKNINAKDVSYIDFLVPGIVAMSVMQMAVFSVAFVFTDYKEKGILKRLLATPMKPQQFVAAQVATRLMVAVVQAAILLSFGSLIFGTTVYGAWWLIALMVVLGGVMFLGLGFTISGIAKTVDAVPAIANLVVFPMLFLSGVFFPTSSMPGWLQNVVTYLPLHPFAVGLREVVANGAGFSDVLTHLAWMGGWAVVMVALAIFTFRFEERRV